MGQFAFQFSTLAWGGFSWCRRNIRWTALGLLVCAGLSVHAQTTNPTPFIPTPPPHDPSDNTFLASPYLPVDLRRVAVLPLAWEGSSTDLAQGSETLGPILLAELIKTKKFEVVAITSEALHHQTGRQSWTGAEVLPVNFLDFLQRVYGCDAVLFCQLTTFRAYPPLVVGWRLKLVDAHTGRILWAADKVFDEKQQKALNQTWHHYFAGLGIGQDSSDNWQIENSPRQFGEYAIVQILTTLPNRKETTKVSPMTADSPSKR
jgi:TolB-like protein